MVSCGLLHPPKAFRRQDTLRDHALTHARAPQHQCGSSCSPGFCNKEFVFAVNRILFSDCFNLQCPLCHLGFPDRLVCRNHLLTQHAETTPRRMMEIAANLGAGAGDTKATVSKQDQDKDEIPGDNNYNIVDDTQEKCEGRKTKSVGGFMIDQLLIN